MVFALRRDVPVEPLESLGSASPPLQAHRISGVLGDGKVDVIRLPHHGERVAFAAAAKSPLCVRKSLKVGPSFTALMSVGRP